LDPYTLSQFERLNIRLDWTHFDPVGCFQSYANINYRNLHKIDVLLVKLQHQVSLNHRNEPVSKYQRANFLAKIFGKFFNFFFNLALGTPLKQVFNILSLTIFLNV